MKVSVILPIYNVSQYLRECLDSVTRQTLKEIEIICVDDGSTDDSLSIIREYAGKDERIIIITGPNGGYGKALNKGLDRATGEYVGIVEPDDYISLTMYEDLYRVAAANDLDIVKADFYRFTRNERGDMNLTYVPLDETRTRYGELLRPGEDPSLIRFVMNTWSGIYRRTMLESYHIRHHETPGASFQDNGFFFQTTVRAKNMMIINRPYYRNRRDNPNSSVNSKEKVYCVNEEYDFIKDFLMSDCAVWETFKEMYSWKKYHNYMFTISRIAEPFRYEYVSRMSAEFKRAYQQGEFSQDVFTSAEWSRLSMIMETPREYYLAYVQNAEGDGGRWQEQYNRTKRELDEIKGSTTYRVGRAIMKVPIAVKRLVTDKNRG